MRAVVAALGAAIISAPAYAEDIACSGVASWGAMGDIRLMRVASSALRLNFVAGAAASKSKTCPSPDAACVLKNYLVKGDDVLAGDVSGNYVCVSFRAPKGRETSGFLPLDALSDIKLGPPAAADWNGAWKRDFEADITIKSAGAKLSVSGNATWGAGDPARVKNGGVHIGELDGEITPKGNLAGLGEGYDGSAPLNSEDRSDCKARLRLFGRYLVVEDNQGCGGANVSFLGIYLKQ